MRRREGRAYVREYPQSFIISPDAPEEEWRSPQADPKGNQAAQNGNRRLVREVVPGSIVIVPRPQDGLIYCGRIGGPFRVNFTEDRMADAEAAFRQLGALSEEHTCESIFASGEVAQGWDIQGDWAPIPVQIVPAWVRRSVFGRSTYGVVDRDNRFGDPVKAMNALIDRVASGANFKPLCVTRDPSVVAQRLKDAVTPNLLEGLVVSLLQLEEPKRAWIGVGGSGDGGVDGIGSDESGDVVGLLQCKWAWDGKEVFPSKNLWRSHGKAIELYLAFFYPPTRFLEPEATKTMDLQHIAKLVLKHSARLPFARTIRVGE